MFFLSALLAVSGAALIVYSDSAAATRKLLTGFLTVQASNLCFAFGQVYYRTLMKDAGWKRERELFGLLYVGAVAASFIPAGVTTDGFLVSLSGPQIQTLLYLGIVPSGIAFFLWNLGAARANAGTLAVLNNAKVPLAILCSLLFFAEHVQSLWRLVVGTVILLTAVIVNEKERR
jgi:drug/metabolite transporter (DMT)-like permease